MNKSTFTEARRSPAINFIMYTPKQQQILFIASLLVLAGLILFGLQTYLSAFLGAGILYVILQPWYTALAIKRNWNRKAVSGLLILFSLMAIVIPFMGLSVLLYDRIQAYSQQTDEIMILVRRVEKLIGYQFTDPKNLQTLIQQVTTYVSKLLPSLAGGVVDFAIIIGLLLFTLYYLFLNEESFQQGLLSYLPFQPDVQQKLGESLKNNVNANVLGQLLVSVVQGTLTGLMLWAFGVNDAPFWGVITAFLSFIPMLGTPIVWLPAGLIQLAEGNTGQGIGILLVGFVVITNIDNLIRMALGKRIGNIHPLVTLVGVVLGIPLFGIVGLVIGPMLLSFFIVLINVFGQENKKQQQAIVTDGVRMRKIAYRQMWLTESQN